MINVILARWQFGATTVYHFFFVPLTIGMSFFIAIMESFYVKTNNESYKKMAKFWGHLFLINFAMGVATGLLQEFQFGMNWSNYSRFVGDVFGVPLALESLLAFFLESTFLGIWIFGWDKVSKRIHLLSIWLVAIATSLSAFFILAANSFMHYPRGYEVVNGKAVMVNFSKLLTNLHLWVQFPHTIFAAWSTASFFILGIAAYHLLRKNNAEWVKLSFKFAVAAAIVSGVLVMSLGDLQGKYVAKYLPMKLASAEALWESKAPAPLSAFSIIDQQNRRNTFELSVPKMLSFLSYSDFHSEVKGINDIQKEYEAKYGPGNYIPPVAISFYAFRIMIAAGGGMLMLCLAALYYHIKKKNYGRRTLLRLLVAAIALPYIANTAGWILTELSRYPWIVFGLLRVDDSASPTVGSNYIMTSFLIYVILYLILIAIDVSLMARFARKPILENEKNKGKEEESLWI